MKKYINEIKRMQLLAGLITEGENAGKVIFDGNKAFVGVAHNSPPEVSEEILKKIKTIGDKYGYWYEGNGADRGPVNQVFGDIKYKGSWDEKIKPTEPYVYVYTLFGNPSQNHRIDQVFKGEGKTILDKLISTYPEWAHDVIKNSTGNAKNYILKFVGNLGKDYLNKLEQEGTRENIENFIMPIGDDNNGLMWKGWPNGSGPAFEMAKKAVYERDEWLISAPEGVYFTGEGHLDSLKDIKPSYKIV
jgi:hypothetical protein